MRHLEFEGGYSVEAGANDGFRQSNTYYLERFRDWRGTLVEPMPDLLAQCRRERPQARCVNCAVVEPDAADGTMMMRFGDLLSHRLTAEDPPAESDVANWGWSRVYDAAVPTKTLSQVFDEAGASRWDFLSLDLEGYELQALRGLDLERHRPTYVLVEAVPMAERLPKLQLVLGDRYELIDQLGPRDLLFRCVD